MNTPSLSRAAFERLATLAGNIGEGMTDAQWERTLRLFDEAMQGTNPRYVGTRFRDWADDVRDGRRTYIGKRITPNEHGYEERLRARMERAA